VVILNAARVLSLEELTAIQHELADCVEPVQGLNDLPSK
jgi:hypothetical protein